MTFIHPVTKFAVAEFFFLLGTRLFQVDCALLVIRISLFINIKSVIYMYDSSVDNLRKKCEWFMNERKSKHKRKE